MGLVLKSNKAVNDPTNQFPIYTEFGSASAILSEYMADRITSGVPVVLSEFNALKAFEQGLDTLGVKSNLLEFYPMLGTTIDSAMVKFKSIEGSSLHKLNGLSGSNYSGLGITMAKPIASTAMPTIGANLTQKNLNNGYTAFIYYNATNENSGTAQRALFGASTADYAPSDLESIYMSIDEVGQIRGRVFQASYASTTATYNKIVAKIAQKIGVEGTATSRKTWKNGTVQDSQPGNVVITPSITNANKEIFIGAINGATIGGANFFYGEIRYMLLFDGNVPDGAVPNIQLLLNDFIVATGKTM